MASTPHRSDYDTFEGLSVEHRRLLRQEELIVEVTEALARALRETNVTQSQLAERLGKTKGFVSQILGGGRNLTLRTLADVVDALECSIQVRIQPELETVVLDWPLQGVGEPEAAEQANDNDRWSNAA